MKLLNLIPAKSDIVGVFANDDETVSLCPVDAFGLFEIYSDGYSTNESFAMYADTDGKLVRFDEAENFLGIVDQNEIAIGSEGKMSAAPNWLFDAMTNYLVENGPRSVSTKSGDMLS